MGKQTIFLLQPKCPAMISVFGKIQMSNIYSNKMFIVSINLHVKVCKITEMRTRTRIDSKTKHGSLLIQALINDLRLINSLLTMTYFQFQ